MSIFGPPEPDTAGGGVSESYVNAAVALRVAKAGDTMTGPLSMGWNTIKNVASPTEAGDAANNTYVDDAVNARVAKTGDTMAGPLYMDWHYIKEVEPPIEAGDATNKVYVDVALDARVAKSGDTMTGPLSMQASLVMASGDNAAIVAGSGIAMQDTIISSLHDPIESDHATNKDYVDTEIALRGINMRTFGFQEVVVRAELGMPDRPQNGGWDITATTPATVTVVDDSAVLGGAAAIKLDDNAGGLCYVSRPLSAADWENIYNFGATYYWWGRLDATFGSNGVFIGLQCDAGDNPQPAETQNRRYGCKIALDGDGLKIDDSGSTNAWTFSEYDPREYHVVKIIIPPLFEDSAISIDDVITEAMLSFGTHSGGAGTKLTVSSGASTGGNRISYIREYGAVIYTEYPTMILTNNPMATTQILIPPGPRTYTIMAALELVLQETSLTMKVVCNNVGGVITFTNWDLGEVSCLFNYKALLHKEITEPVTLEGIQISSFGAPNIVGL